MTAKDDQIKTLRREMREHGNLTRAAQAAKLSRLTARKYLRAAALPSEIQKRNPRRFVAGRRPSPILEEHERELLDVFLRNRMVTATGLLRLLMERHPGLYSEGNYETVARRLRKWRELHGVQRKTRRRAS